MEVGGLFTERAEANRELEDPRIGLIFMVGCLFVFSVPAPQEFSLLAAGVSALLAWLPIVLVPDATRRRGCSS